MQLLVVHVSFLSVHACGLLLASMCGSPLSGLDNRLRVGGCSRVSNAFVSKAGDEHMSRREQELIACSWSVAAVAPKADVVEAPPPPPPAPIAVSAPAPVAAPAPAPQKVEVTKPAAAPVAPVAAASPDGALRVPTPSPVASPPLIDSAMSN